MTLSKWYNKSENGRALYIFEEEEISVPLDMVAVNMLSNNNIRCLVPATFSQMDTTRYIKFDISSRIPFREFVSRPTNFNTVAQLLINMFTGLKDLRRYMIDTNSLMFNVDLMFIDMSVPMLSFILDPVLDEHRSTDIREFIRSLLMRLQILDNDKLGYVINYLNSRNFTSDGFVKELTNLISSNSSQQSAQASQSSEFESFVNGQGATAAKQASAMPTPARAQEPPVREVSVPQPESKTAAASTAEKSKGGLFGGLFGGHSDIKKKASSVKSAIGGFSVPGKSDKPASGGFAIPGKSAPAPVSGSFAIPGQSDAAPASSGFAIPGKSDKPLPGGFAIPGQSTATVSPMSQPRQEAVAESKPPMPVMQGAPAEMPQSPGFDFPGGARQERYADEDNDVTEMPGEGGSEEGAPKLIRVSTAEIVDINKDSFSIGRDPKSLVDYVINDKRVSRRHASIIHKNNNYFLVDLGSKNHTYVNGNMLISNMETNRNNGDKIRIAFEEFIFEI